MLVAVVGAGDRVEFLAPLLTSKRDLISPFADSIPYTRETNSDSISLFCISAETEEPKILRYE